MQVEFVSANGPVLLERPVPLSIRTLMLAMHGGVPLFLIECSTTLSPLFLSTCYRKWSLKPLNLLPAVTLLFLALGAKASALLPTSYFCGTAG